MEEPKRVSGLGVYSELDKIDIITPLMPMLERAGYYINTDGLITHKRGIAWQTPWIHVVRASGKRCNLDHHVIFEHFGFIPVRCQECWKVVASPRTLKELFALEKLEYELGLPSKCGIEVRPYTPRLYGGYFYNNSLEQGRETYRIVREAISDKISPDIGVILKRGCTEMELGGGPSPFWKITKKNLATEQFIEERVDHMQRLDNNQPDYVCAHIHKKWIQWAYQNGDETYKEYTGGHDMYAPVVKYHEGDINEIKTDILMARSGIVPEKANGFMDKINAAMEEFKLSRENVERLMGFTQPNPLYIGGHDELT